MKRTKAPIALLLLWLSFFMAQAASAAVPPTKVELFCNYDATTNKPRVCNVKDKEACIFAQAVCTQAFGAALSIPNDQFVLNKIYFHSAKAMIGLNKYLIKKGLVASGSTVSQLAGKIGNAIKSKFTARKADPSAFLLLTIDVAYQITNDFLLNNINYKNVGVYKDPLTGSQPFSRLSKDDTKKVFNWWSQLAYNNIKGAVLAAITHNPILVARETVVGDLLVLADISSATFAATGNAIANANALTLSKKYSQAMNLQYKYASSYYKAKGAQKAVVMGQFLTACHALTLRGVPKFVASVNRSLVQTNGSIREYCTSTKQYMENTDANKLRVLSSAVLSMSRARFGNFIDYHFPIDEKVTYMGYYDLKHLNFIYFPDAPSNSQIATLLRRANMYRLPLEPYAGGTLFSASSPISKQYATYLSFIGAQVVGNKILHSVSDNTFGSLLTKAKASTANLTGAALPITRAELARIVVSAFKLNVMPAFLQNIYKAEATKNPFWTYESIILRHLGVVFPDTSFDPTRIASRYEALIILNNTMDILTCKKKNCGLIDIARGIY